MKLDKWHWHTCKDSKYLLPGWPSLGRLWRVCSYKRLGNNSKSKRGIQEQAPQPGDLHRKTQDVGRTAGLEGRCRAEERGGRLREECVWGGKTWNLCVRVSGKFIHWCVVETLQHLGNINNLYLENFSTQGKWSVLESLRESTVI